MEPPEAPDPSEPTPPPADPTLPARPENIVEPGLVQPSDIGEVEMKGDAWRRTREAIERSGEDE